MSICGAKLSFRCCSIPGNWNLSLITLFSVMWSWYKSLGQASSMCPGPRRVAPLGHTRPHLTTPMVSLDTDSVSCQVGVETVTSIAGVHKMRLLHWHSSYHCFWCHLLTLYPQKWPKSLFENNTGRTYGPTDLRTDTTSYRHATAHLKRDEI